MIVKVGKGKKEKGIVKRLTKLRKIVTINQKIILKILYKCQT